MSIPPAQNVHTPAQNVHSCRSQALRMSILTGSQTLKMSILTRGQTLRMSVLVGGQMLRMSILIGDQTLKISALQLIEAFASQEPLVFLLVFRRYGFAQVHLEFGPFTPSAIENCEESFRHKLGQ